MREDMHPPHWTTRHTATDMSIDKPGGRKPTRILYVVRSLHGKASVIDRLALAALDHELADAHARPQHQRCGAQIGHL